jgi:cysteine desulfurase
MTEMRSARPWVYLDNNATTRVDSRVLEAMLPFFREHFANPSSEHSLGTAVAEAVKVARRQVQTLIVAAFDKEIVFTSGGSESNNAAIFSALETQQGRDEVITSTVEHPAILSVCDHLERTGRARVHRIPVDRDGLLDLDAYRRVLSPSTALVSIQWANNETGTLFPVERLAAMAHADGAIFHCDAVQAAGKLDLQVQSTQIDMLSISAHKMHGPKGVGALYIRNGVRVAPLIHGGHQERRRRAGTENSAAIVGFGVAAELAAQILPYETPRIAALRDRLEQGILRNIPGAIVIGSRDNRLPNTLNIAFEDVESDSILMLLNRASIAASTGSACSSGSMEPSHVLRAMKVPFAYLRGAVRFSFSRENSEDDVHCVLEVLPQLVKDLRLTMVPLEAACDYA